MDRVSVTGLRARGTHGVHDFERERGQQFVVDLHLDVDTAPAAGSDQLTDTVDYAAVAASVAAVVTGPPVALLETLAQRIADECLSDPRVQSVEVTVHKPDAPVGVAVDDVSVTIRRSR